jgi:hypothetical protein
MASSSTEPAAAAFKTPRGFEDVALPCAVGSDETVHSPEVKGLIDDRLETLDVDPSKRKRSSIDDRALFRRNS